MAGYVLTVYTAPPGTPEGVYHPSTQTYTTESALVGHMYYTITGPSGAVTSYGFAPENPGAGLATVQGNVFHNDVGNYATPASDSVSINISQAQYDTLSNFGLSPSSYGFDDSKYNAFVNNCTDFTWAALEQIGIYRPQQDLYDIVNNYDILGILTGMLPEQQLHDVTTALNDFAAHGSNYDPYANDQFLNNYDIDGNLESTVVTDVFGNPISTTQYSYDNNYGTVNGVTTNQFGDVTSTWSANQVLNSSGFSTQTQETFFNNGNQTGLLSIQAASNGQVNASVSGQAGSINLSNSTVQIAPNSQLALDGTQNTVPVPAGGDLLLSSSTGLTTTNSGGLTADLSSDGGLGSTYAPANGTPIGLAGAEQFTYNPATDVGAIQFGPPAGSPAAPGAITETVAINNSTGQATATTTGNGQSTTTTLSSSAPSAVYSSLASAFGSSLGNILASSNPLAQIALSSATGPFLGDVVTLIQDSDDTNLSAEFDSLVGALPSSVADAGAGAAAAYLLGDLISALHLPKAAQNVLDTVGGYAVSSIASNITNSVDPITGISSDPDVSNGVNLDDATNWELLGAEFVGSQIGSAIYQPSTQDGEEGAAVLTAINSAADAYLAFSYPWIVNPYFLAAVAIMAVLDEVFGGIFGDLFGQASTSSIAGATITLSGSASSPLSAGYYLSYYQADPTTPELTQDATGAGEAIIKALNATVNAVGGTVLNISSLTSFGIGFNLDAAAAYDSTGTYSGAGLAYYYADGTTKQNPQYWASDANIKQELIDYAVMRELSEMQFSDGNPYMERAIDAALRSVPDFGLGGDVVLQTPSTATLAGDIKIAGDYQLYDANTVTINAMIAANPTSSFSQT
jgi:hypothetical protein